MNDDNRAFYAEHYGPSTKWTVEELHLAVYIPTSEPDGWFELVSEILADASFDIRVEAMPSAPRRFLLNRVQDVTGLSGTGIVAEGIEFSDGTAVVRWLERGVSQANRDRGVAPTTVVHPSIRSIEALHGHNGATRLEWID